jgi:dicarboxylate transporter 10
MIERFNYRNSIQGLARMTREEGISSWARGIAPNTVRAILMNMSQLAR